MKRRLPGKRVNQANRTKFLIELIKPSHYDDDGYLIQWWRGFVPSSSLSNLYGLALDAKNNVYVANSGNNSITEYGAKANGNTKPINTIAGPDTGLSLPTGVMLSGNTLYVDDFASASVTVDVSFSTKPPPGNSMATETAPMVLPATVVVGC